MDIIATKRGQIVKSDPAGTLKNTATDFSELANGNILNVNGFVDLDAHLIFTPNASNEIQLSKGYGFAKYIIDGRTGFARCEVVNDIVETITESDGTYFLYMELNLAQIIAGSSDVDGADVWTLKFESALPVSGYFLPLYQITMLGGSSTVVVDLKEKRKILIDYNDVANNIDLSDLGSKRLKDLDDVDDTLSPSADDVLVWNGVANQFESQNLSAGLSVPALKEKVILGETVVAGDLQGSVFVGKQNIITKTTTSPIVFNIGQTVTDILTLGHSLENNIIQLREVDSFSTVGTPGDLTVTFDYIENTIKTITLTNGQVTGGTFDIANEYLLQNGERLVGKGVITARFELNVISAVNYYRCNVENDIFIYNLNDGGGWASRTDWANRRVEVGTMSFDVEGDGEVTELTIGGGSIGGNLVTASCQIRVGATVYDTFGFNGTPITRVLSIPVVNGERVILDVQGTSARTGPVYFTNSLYSLDCEKPIQTVEDGLENNKFRLSSSKYIATRKCDGIIVESGIANEEKLMQKSGSLSQTGVVLGILYLNDIPGSFGIAMGTNKYEVGKGNSNSSISLFIDETNRISDRKTPELFISGQINVSGATIQNSASYKSKYRGYMQVSIRLITSSSSGRTADGKVYINGVEYWGVSQFQINKDETYFMDFIPFEANDDLQLVATQNGNQAVIFYKIYYIKD